MGECAMAGDKTSLKKSNGQKHTKVAKHYKRRDPRSSKNPEKNGKKTILTSIFLKPLKSIQRQRHNTWEKNKDKMVAGFPGGSAGKEPACNSGGDLGLIPGLGTSPGEGKDYPVQCSGLENSMDCYGLDYTDIKSR